MSTTRRLNEPRLRELLRSDTREIHQRLDDHVGGFETREDYADFVERSLRLESGSGEPTGGCLWDENIPLFNETFRSRMSVPAPSEGENASRTLQMPVKRLFQKYAAISEDAFG